MSSPSLQQLPPEYYAEYRGNELLASSITFLIVQSLVFCAYIASRLIHGQSNETVFWVLVTAAYLSVLSISISGILCVEIGGMGRHFAYYINDPALITRYLKLQTATEILYMAAITFPKFVICAFYLRIFTDKTLRFLTWVVVGVLVGFFLGGFISAFTICQPFAYKWDKSIDGHCADLMAEYRYISIPGIVTDLFILFLPMPMIWRLQVGRAKKFGIFLTFLTGSLGIVVCIIRMVKFFTVDLLSDPTYLGITTMTLTIAEPSAYFICACMLGMRPLLERAAHKTGINKLTHKLRGNSTKGSRDSRKNTYSSDATLVGRSNHSSSSDVEDSGFEKVHEYKAGSDYARSHEQEHESIHEHV